MSDLIAALVRSRPASVLFLLAICGAIYANTLGNSFQYDDRHAIVENDHIQSLSSIPGFLTHPEHFSRDADKAMYRPVFLASLALNHAWSGYETYSYHLINILLHALASIFVWLLFAELRLSGCLALLGGAVFAVHPLVTEPVNYISSRSELMVALFVLASIWLYLRSCRPHEALSRRRALLLRSGSVACFAAALGSKEVGIVLPLLLLLADRCGGRSWRPQVVAYVPYGLVAGVYLLYIRSFVGTALVDEPVRSLSLQLGTQLKALPYYAQLVVMPTALSVRHAFSESSLAELPVILSLLAVVSLIAVASAGRDARGGGAHTRPREGLTGFGLAWMGIVLMPTFVVPLNVLVNEHRLYLALVGAVLAVLGIRRFETLRSLRWGGPTLAILLAVLVVQQNRVWRDEGTLWSNALRRAPSAVEPYVYLGNHARGQGEHRRSIPLFESALELEPQNLAARSNLANAHRELGQWEQALTIYAGVLAEHPDQADVHYNMARTYQDAGDRPSARSHYLAVDSTSHHYDLALNNLGTLWEQDGRPDSAAVYYRAALAREPANTDARANLRRLGGALSSLAPGLLRRGEHGVVADLCRQLLLENPRGRDALWFLTASLFEAGAYTQSIEVNRRLVRDHPDFWYGHLQLGNALQTIDDRSGAEEVYEWLASHCRDEDIRRDAAARYRLLQAGGRP